ncbi:MAG TPA: S-adenosylmethionine:tRNA ribosyltransferase-isomerase [Kofleriaceae bacterium]
MTALALVPRESAGAASCESDTASRESSAASCESDAASREAASPALRTDAVPSRDVRLVVVDTSRASAGADAGVAGADARASVEPRIVAFAALPQLLAAGDLVVVNDAATLPGAIAGRTVDGRAFELRLSGPVDGSRVFGVVLGEGDRTLRTEERPAPPVLRANDRVRIGALAATVVAAAGRRVELAMRAPEDALWRELYAAGAPVQYAHRPEALALWDVQTSYAARPWAAEMPSAGRPLTWETLLALRRAGVELASLTHAAGLSSTGDAALDRALPWPERYEIPRRTIDAIARTRARGGRVIAAGTTVVRALEAAALGGELHAGSGTATLRIDGRFAPRVVAGLVSGLHAPGESHFDLLSAFAPRELLVRATELAAAHGLSGHELGDSCLILRGPTSGPPGGRDHAA